MDPPAKCEEPIDERMTALWRLVKDLSLAQQRVVIMRHVYRLLYAKIARRLKCAENAYKQLR